MGGHWVGRTLYFVVLGSAGVTQSHLSPTEGGSALSPSAASGSLILQPYILSRVALKPVRPPELSPVGEMQHKVQPLCCWQGTGALSVEILKTKDIQEQRGKRDF